MSDQSTDSWSWSDLGGGISSLLGQAIGGATQIGIANAQAKTQIPTVAIDTQTASGGSGFNAKTIMWVGGGVVGAVAALLVLKKVLK
ncbi:hypothetical protein FACS1894186_4300 [Alphaproteobacteria bacterium]|nr:hypothetical protein FACS1894186_4300 [Alphaproteobacteria bacterium]